MAEYSHKAATETSRAFLDEVVTMNSDSQKDLFILPKVSSFMVGRGLKQLR